MNASPSAFSKHLFDGAGGGGVGVVGVAVGEGGALPVLLVVLVEVVVAVRCRKLIIANQYSERSWSARSIGPSPIFYRLGGRVLAKRDRRMPESLGSHRFFTV